MAMNIDGEKYLSHYLLSSTNDSISPSILAETLKEINEIPENITKHIEDLREKLAEEKDLNSQLDNDFLLKFLRARKYDIQRTRELIKAYYKERLKHKDMFKSTNASSVLKQLFDDKVLVLLPNRDKRGRKIILCNGRNWKPAEINLTRSIVAFLYFIEKLIEEEETQICGITAILNLKDISFTQVRHFTLFQIRLIIDIVQNNFPARLKELHVVNESLVTRATIALVTAFLSAKQRNRVLVQGTNFSILQQYIDVDVLPEEYGGNWNMNDFNTFSENFQDSEIFFEKMLSFGYNITVQNEEGNGNE